MSDKINSFGKFPEPELSKLLAQLPLFDGLTQEQVCVLCSETPVVTQLTHTVVMRQGEIERVAFIIVSGSVKVRVEVETGEVDIATLGPGAVIGEISLLCGTPRAASVIALEPL